MRTHTHMHASMRTHNMTIQSSQCDIGPTRSGCSTSEDMLWKLDALQSFIHDLHWPEEVFAEHLDHRLKLMAADMIEAAAKRYFLLLLSVSRGVNLPSV